MNIVLRRRKLGKKSVNGITAYCTRGLHPVRNWLNEWPNGPIEYVFRWGCTSNIPEEEAKVVNKASAIHWCSDKRQGRLDMQAAGVSVPETWTSEEFLRACEHTEGGFNEWLSEGEFVLRPARHAQGRWLQHGTAEVISCHADRSSYINGYVSRLINKVAEYRVFVCQNRAVWVARKTPGNPDQVAWNVAQGGRFDNVRWDDWPIRVVQEALKAAKVSGCDFCGVDVMVDAEDKPYVLEVNSAPSQTSEYRQKCVAKAFDFIVQHGKEHFPDPERVRTYKSLIHPAMRANDGPVRSSSEA